MSENYTSEVNPWHVTVCELCLEGITSGSEIGYVPDGAMMHMDCAVAYVDGWGEWTYGVAP